MTLHFQKFGDVNTGGASPLVFIHGLFGSGTNWRSIAREFASERQTYVLDLRNHGNSKHLPSHTYLELASDIQEFVMSEGLQNYILCGHSMGGKAVMTNALMSSDLIADDQLKAIIVLDIAPVAYKHSHSNNLAALKQLDIETLTSRAEADKLLQASIPNAGVRLFLLQSLERTESGFRWKLNLNTLDEYMSDIVGYPSHLLTDKQFNKPALFTYGADSDFVQAGSHALIKKWFPQAQLDEIKGAGHWIHIDQREAMMASIRHFVNRIS